jgi:hypothetical protein
MGPPYVQGPARSGSYLRCTPCPIPTNSYAKPNARHHLLAWSASGMPVRCMPWLDSPALDQITLDIESAMKNP